MPRLFSPPSFPLAALIGGMITKLDEVLNATEANGAAAAAAAGPFYTVAYPFEVGSVGGDMIKIGGYNFIPGIAIYTSTWTYTAPSGETTVVESEPTAATSMNLLEVEAPAWPHQPAQTEYIGALTISQAGVMIPSLTPVVTTFQAMVPTMTDLSGNLQVQDVSGNSWRFNVTVADVDSDVSDVRITATATNSSFVTSIRDISSDMSSENRTLEVILPNSDGCGQSNVTITITDNLGLRSNQTFELFISCDSWVPIVRTANSRSNYGTFGYGIDQMRSRLVADTGTNIGAFRAISTQTGARYIRITKLSGTRDVGTYAIFRLVAPLSGSVLATMFGCGVTNAYTRSPSTTQWTAAYSGQKVDGTLPLYNRYNQRQSLRYVFICGINMSADDDHSLLAFTYRTGYSNDVSYPVPAKREMHCRTASAPLGHLCDSVHCRLPSSVRPGSRQLRCSPRTYPTRSALPLGFSGAIRGGDKASAAPSGRCTTTTTREAGAGARSRVGRGTRLAAITRAATRSTSALQRLFKAPPPCSPCGVPITVRRSWDKQTTYARSFSPVYSVPQGFTSVS